MQATQLFYLNISGKNEIFCIFSLQVHLDILNFKMDLRLSLDFWVVLKDEMIWPQRIKKY